VFQGKRVLAIDDSVAVRNYLRAILTRQGASVDVASTGQQGLEMCAPDRLYDLILIDLILPDVNGIEVLKSIRQRSDEPAIVILTGVGGVKSAIAAVEHGADGYIEKQEIAMGSDLTEFLHILEQALERRASKATLEREIAERQRAEEAVRQQAQILEQIHDSVISMDLAGYVTSWNKGSERLYGYTEAEAMGQHISFVYPEDEYQFLQQRVIAPLKERGTHEIEVRMCRKSGVPSMTFYQGGALESARCCRSS